MKKIVILSQNYPPYIKGGAEISTALMVKAMKKDFEINVVTCKYAKKPWIHEDNKVIPILVDMYKDLSTSSKKINHYLDMITYHFKNYFRTKVILKELDPDLIQCVFGGHYYLPSVIAAIHTNKPVVIDVRDYVLLPIKYTEKSIARYPIYLYEKISSMIYLNSIKHSLAHKNSKVRIITISEYLKKQLVTHGFKSERIEVIPNLLPDIPNVTTKKITDKSIAFAGRLTSEKGIWTLVEAFQKLDDNSIKLNIAGDGPEKEKLKAYIIKNKVKNIFLLGKLTNKEVIELYKKSHLIAAPSIWPEPFGRFIQESYATLTPCIATDTGGIPEGITNNKTGLLVRPNDSKALEQAISSLLSNRHLYSKMIENLKKYRSKFESENIAKMRGNLYKDLIKSI